MSFSAAAWAIRQEIQNSTQKLILIILADCYNDETQRCYPSYQYIAKLAGCSQCTVHRAIKELEDNGIIEVTKRDGKSSYYHLIQTPCNLQPLAPVQGHPLHGCNDTPCTSAIRTYKEPIKEPITLSGDKPQKKTKQKRRTQIPPDFKLTDDLYNKAAQYWHTHGHQGDIVDCFASFIDHHRAKGSVMADWGAAWGTWYRNAVKFAKNEAQGESGGFIAKHSDNSWADSL